MTFVPGCEHDIFVSYAHVDDQPTVGAEKGWVTTLIEGLKVCLDQKLGRKDAYSLWMDHELSRHKSFSDEIVQSLESTATCLVIASPAYLASEWCDREREVFLKAFQDRPDGGARFFVVEREQIEDGERPEPFRDLLGYRFWVDDREGRAPRTLGVPVPNPTEHAYFDLINDLAYDLAKLLKKLARGEPAEAEKKAPAATEADSKSVAETASNGRAIYLAEVTDDIDTLREGTRRYLDQAGVRVLPETLYSRDPDAFREAVDQDLEQSEMFVQLLSPLPGKRPPGLSQGYVGLQYERARELGKPILQWRAHDLDPASVEAGDHRSLLDGENVQATGIEEFKSAVKERLEKSDSKREQPINAFVFVDVDEEHQAVADEVCARLDELGIGYVLPVQKAKPAEKREDLQFNLMDCDALIVIYGGTSSNWVREQLRFFRKYLHQRETPLEVLTVLEGPPHEKDPLGFKLPNMKILDCRDGVDREALDSFIEDVREKISDE